MKAEGRVESISAMAALLSNPLRLRILLALRAGPCIVGDLVERLGEGQATVSKQLAVFRTAGLLACRPDGRCREYALADPGSVGAVLDFLDALGASARRQALECRLRSTRRAVSAASKKNPGPL